MNIRIFSTVVRKYHRQDKLHKDRMMFCPNVLQGNRVVFRPHRMFDPQWLRVKYRNHLFLSESEIHGYTAKSRCLSRKT